MSTVSPEVIQKIKQSMKEQDQNFIADRSVNEQNYNLFIESLMQLPDEYKSRLTVPIDPRPYKDVYPSLFKEPLNFEEYRAEVNANRAFLIAVDKLRTEVTEEAIEFYGIK